MIKLNSKSLAVIGAVTGDIVGSVYEFNNIKTTEFDFFNSKARFTDDTVLTMAVADCIVNNKDFSKTLGEYGLQYPDAGYGPGFIRWLHDFNREPYGSFGNGSAMRVSSIGSAYDSLVEVQKKAHDSAAVSHNHPEGIKGAKAIASAIFLAKIGKTKLEIKNQLSLNFDYNLDFTLDHIRDSNYFDSSCERTVPQAIVAFLESTDFENAIRLAISIGGDSDTIACMTGGIAAAFYKKIPLEIIEFVSNKLPNQFIELINKLE